MKRALFLTVCLCAFFPLVACQAEEPTEGQEMQMTGGKCPNEKIRVEMSGNLLEFTRDDVWKIYIPNPDKTDAAYKYLDVSKSCNVTFQEGVEIVSDIKTQVPAVLSLGITNRQLGSYYDLKYKEKLEKHKSDIVKYNHGVLQVVTGEKRGFFILTETGGLEINGDPIAFECSLHKCGTNYIHPSGLVVSISVVGWSESPFLVEKLKTVNQKINSLFVAEGEE